MGPQRLMLLISLLIFSLFSTATAAFPTINNENGLCEYMPPGIKAACKFITTTSLGAPAPEAAASEYFVKPYTLPESELTRGTLSEGYEHSEPGTEDRFDPVDIWFQNDITSAYVLAMNPTVPVTERILRPVEILVMTNMEAQGWPIHMLASHGKLKAEVRMRFDGMAPAWMKQRLRETGTIVTVIVGRNGRINLWDLETDPQFTLIIQDDEHRAKHAEEQRRESIGWFYRFLEDTTKRCSQLKTRITSEYRLQRTITIAPRLWMDMGRRGDYKLPYSLFPLDASARGIVVYNLWYSRRSPDSVIHPHRSWTAIVVDVLFALSPFVAIFVALLPLLLRILAAHIRLLGQFMNMVIASLRLLALLVWQIGTWVFSGLTSLGPLFNRPWAALIQLLRPWADWFIAGMVTLFQLLGRLIGMILTWSGNQRLPRFPAPPTGSDDDDQDGPGDQPPGAFPHSDSSRPPSSSGGDDSDAPPPNNATPRAPPALGSGPRNEPPSAGSGPADGDLAGPSSDGDEFETTMSPIREGQSLADDEKPTAAERPVGEYVIGRDSDSKALDRGTRGRTLGAELEPVDALADFDTALEEMGSRMPVVRPEELSKAFSSLEELSKTGEVQEEASAAQEEPIPETLPEIQAAMDKLSCEQIISDDEIPPPAVNPVEEGKAKEDVADDKTPPPPTQPLDKGKAKEESASPPEFVQPKLKPRSRPGDVLSSAKQRRGQAPPQSATNDSFERMKSLFNNRPTAASTTRATPPSAATPPSGTPSAGSTSAPTIPAASRPSPPPIQPAIPLAPTRPAGPYADNSGFRPIGKRPPHSSNLFGQPPAASKDAGTTSPPSPPKSPPTTPDPPQVWCKADHYCENKSCPLGHRSLAIQNPQTSGITFDLTTKCPHDLRCKAVRCRYWHSSWYKCRMVQMTEEQWVKWRDTRDDKWAKNGYQ